MRSLSFKLPMALPSLNQLNRERWARARKRIPDREQAALAWDVLAAMGGPHWIPNPPFAKARVTVVRHSAGTLDYENLVGACKPLRDVLCVKSRTHPCGLGIIEDDATDKGELVVTQEKSKRGGGFTAVRVEELA